MKHPPSNQGPVLPAHARSTEPFELGPGPGEAVAAVLLLHGFTGSPWELRPLGESLVARGFHVLAPRLPGHNSADAMAWVSHRDWERAANEGLDALSPYSNVFITGLSMGALLALLLAGQRPQRVKGLALLAPAWRFRAFNVRLLHALRWLPMPDVTSQWIAKTTTDIEDDEVRKASPLLPRYPIARVLDLFLVQDKVRAVLKQVVCPSLVVGARNDHVIPFSAVAQLHQRLPHSQLVELSQGYHIIPRDRDRATAASCVAEFFERHLTQEAAR